jgi:hypothetical protein
MRRWSFRLRMALIILVVLIMFALHNSFWLWQWDATFPLLFGFMPFAFSYYVFYALLATLVMNLVVYLVWPDPPKGLLDGGKEAHHD